MRLILLTAITLSLAAPAVAAAPNVSAAFGNTVVSTYPDGRKGKLWLKADGSYTAAGRRGKPSSGRWSIKGAKICLKQQKPGAGPFTYCTTPPSGAIGSTWNAKAVTGERIKVTIVKGIVRAS